MVGVGASAARRSVLRMEARLRAPMPMPVRSKNWRRVKMRLSREGECSRRYLSWSSWGQEQSEGFFILLII